jgi:hypothetical protein
VVLFSSVIFDDINGNTSERGNVQKTCLGLRKKQVKGRPTSFTVIGGECNGPDGEGPVAWQVYDLKTISIMLQERSDKAP